MAKTLVLGATTNPERTAYQAVHRLVAAGHEVIPVGIREGAVAGITIQNDRPQVENLDTVSLYLNPTIQADYYDYILELKPRRVIFNPGTENPSLSKLLRENQIETEHACTLVLLATGAYEH